MVHFHHIDLNRPPRIQALGNGRMPAQGRSRWYGLPFWCLHAYTYEADLVVDSRHYTVVPGAVSLIAPGCDITYRWRGEVHHAFAHLDLEPGPVALPEFRSPDVALATFPGDFSGAVGWQASTPARAVARIWDLLWRLAGAGEQAPGSLVGRARELIERDLAGVDSVANLARALAVSHNTLTRHFRSDLGCTVKAYLRQRRAARAADLLASGLAASEVAAAVGVADLQALNKLLRREFGRSPRALVKPDQKR